MPNKDGTGPEGKGPMTGRRAGKCPDVENDEYAAPGRGRGRGRRNRQFGSGRGRRLFRNRKESDS